MIPVFDNSSTILIYKYLGECNIIEKKLPTSKI